MSVYKITKFSDADGFLTNFATVRGKARNGVPVNTAAARTVLHDWNEGMPDSCTYCPLVHKRFYRMLMVYWTLPVRVITT